MEWVSILTAASRARNVYALVVHTARLCQCAELRLPLQQPRGVRIRAITRGDDKCHGAAVQVQLMEEMIQEHAEAIKEANHPPPWFQVT